MYTTVDSPVQRAGTAPRGGRPETAPVKIPAPRRPADDASWRLPHRPEAVSDARRLARSVLNCWDIGEDDLEAVVLVVSELVTNAVEHALAPVVLEVRREQASQRVRVEVSDGGPAPREGAWMRSCSGDEHGRGLAMVEALADTHGTRTRRRGAVHWACLPAAA